MPPVSSLTLQPLQKHELLNIYLMKSNFYAAIRI